VAALYIHRSPMSRSFIAFEYSVCPSGKAACRLRKYGIVTAWSIVLLEKLTGFQLVKKFPAFY